MNQRIQQLAEQAFKSLETDPVYATAMIYASKELEKFAELIVKECMNNLYLHGYDDAAQCLQDIHFGIEDPV